MKYDSGNVVPYDLPQYFRDTFIHKESGDECIIRDFIKLFTNCYCPLQFLKSNACFNLKIYKTAYTPATSLGCCCSCV
jgi:hypothetical protein